MACDLEPQICPFIIQGVRSLACSMDLIDYGEAAVGQDTLGSTREASFLSLPCYQQTPKFITFLVKFHFKRSHVALVCACSLYSQFPFHLPVPDFRDYYDLISVGSIELSKKICLSDINFLATEALQQTFSTCLSILVVFVIPVVLLDSY